VNAAAAFVLVAQLLIVCPLAFASSTVTLPPSPPTIPSDVIYALGQQGGLLTSIAGRLDKIEIKLEDIQRDVTRINTIGAIAGLLFTVVLGPIAVYKIRQKLDRGPKIPTSN